MSSHAWQGSATVSRYRGHGLDRKLTAKDNVHFALDENADAIKWTIEAHRPRRDDNGGQMLLPSPLNPPSLQSRYQEAGMFTQRNVYEYSSAHMGNGGESKKHLMIWRRGGKLSKIEYLDYRPKSYFLGSKSTHDLALIRPKDGVWPQCSMLHYKTPQR
jgi:hypothetical protein